MSLYALNLFDLADNDDYLAYSRRSVDAVQRHGGTVAALGKLDADAPVLEGDTHAAPGDGARRVAEPGGVPGVPRRPRATRTCTRCARTARATTCGGPTTSSRTCGRCSGDDPGPRPGPGQPDRGAHGLQRRARAAVRDRPRGHRHRRAGRPLRGPRGRPGRARRVRRRRARPRAGGRSCTGWSPSCAPPATPSSPRRSRSRATSRRAPGCPPPRRSRRRWPSRSPISTHPPRPPGAGEAVQPRGERLGRRPHRAARPAGGAVRRGRPRHPDRLPHAGDGAGPARPRRLDARDARLRRLARARRRRLQRAPRRDREGARAARARQPARRARRPRPTRAAQPPRAPRRHARTPA